MTGMPEALGPVPDTTHARYVAQDRGPSTQEEEAGGSEVVLGTT